MKMSEPPTPDEFEALLAWLDPDDRDRAGTILCEEIRPKLIKVFERRQCYAAEEMADETINRVSHRVKDIAATYEGEPVLYFHGCLKKVYLEWVEEEKKKKKWFDGEKRKQSRSESSPLPMPDPSEDVERMHAYLEKCRLSLENPEDRDLIIEYYQNERRAKIDHRKALAERLGITLNNLRMRIHRINGLLHKCIVNCLNDAGSSGVRDVLA